MVTNTGTEYRKLQRSAKRAYLSKGLYIRITKTKKKKGFFSKIEVGESKAGHISKDLEFGIPLYFYEMGDQCVTGALKKVFLKNGETYIETKTSIYKVTFL